MKKLTALVMALVLVLCAASAMAAGSKTNADITTTTVVTRTYNPTKAITLKIISNTDESAAVIKQFQDAYNAGNVLSPLPDSIKKQLGAASSINEMLTAQFDGDVDAMSTDCLVNAKLQTLYSPAGDKVNILIGKLGGTNMGWYVTTGTIMADGSINIIVPKYVLMQVKNNPFILAVVSK